MPYDIGSTLDDFPETKPFYTWLITKYPLRILRLQAANKALDKDFWNLRMNRRKEDDTKLAKCMLQTGIRQKMPVDDDRVGRL